MADDDEFDLIRRHFADRVTSGGLVRFGIGDDCAFLAPRSGCDLAVSIDTLIEGVHFPRATPAGDVGHKALACGLSDLAAAGARPEWALLSLTLQRAEAAWVDDFARGFTELAHSHGVVLAGGDITRGSLSVTVQVGGSVASGCGLTRSGARVGDSVYISGWPGCAAAGLERLVQGRDDPDDPLVDASRRPPARVALGRRLLEARATSCIDVSDGLAADLGHILEASGVGAMIETEALPRARSLCAAGDERQVLDWILHGGDDYELCFTLEPDGLAEIANPADSGVPVSCIGHIVAEPGLYLRDASGELTRCETTGYRHFSG